MDLRAVDWGGGRLVVGCGSEGEVRVEEDYHDC